MKTSVTILALFLFTASHAQRVQYAPPEKGFKAYASYDIIGHVGDHFLVFIKGQDRAEIVVYDETMQKLASIPANILGSITNHVSFVAYPDHFLAFYQYRTASGFYCGVFKGDADGRVVKGPAILDSVPFAEKYSWQKRLGGVNDRKSAHPVFILLHSEDLNLHMSLKFTLQENGSYDMTSVLYGKDLEPLDSSSVTYASTAKFSECSEFILDNDGDLFFAGMGRDEEGEPIREARLLIKHRGIDSLSTIPLTRPGMELEDLRIKADNANRRIILTSLYYATGEKHLTGLCNLIWDKPENKIVGPSLFPLPHQIRNEAIAVVSNAEQILDYYYLRQTLVRADGDFMVLAELFDETSVLSTRAWKRDDFVRGRPDSVVTLPDGFLSFKARERPGYWAVSGAYPVAVDAYKGYNRSTQNVLVFLLDKSGATRQVKIIKKDTFSPLLLCPLSFQTFVTGKDIHLIYNERVLGNYLPAITTIHADGTLEQEQMLHDLDKSHFFSPLFGKQVGPKTMIIPCEINKSLCFAKVDY